MINTEWESHMKRIREALQFGFLMPLYIAAWVVCIIAAVMLELAWRIGQNASERERKGERTHGQGITDTF